MTTKTSKPKILRVWTETANDDSPDTSCLGEYGGCPLSEWAIDRNTRGDMCNGEFRYWNPGENHIPPGLEENWSYVSDVDICVAMTAAGLAPCDKRQEAIKRLDLHYIEQDYLRMESLQNGNWYYVGIIAKAEVQLERHGVIQILRSGGLWGIESDSGEDYLNEVRAEQLSELAWQLRLIGFGERAIKFAIKSVEKQAK